MAAFVPQDRPSFLARCLVSPQTNRGMECDPGFPACRLSAQAQAGTVGGEAVLSLGVSP